MQREERKRRGFKMNTSGLATEEEKVKYVQKNNRTGNQYIPCRTVKLLDYLSKPAVDIDGNIWFIKSGMINAKAGLFTLQQKDIDKIDELMDEIYTLRKELMAYIQIAGDRATITRSDELEKLI